ncbi:MAG: hypothetical protein WD896_01135 [Parcubacteria group bacterium]
MTTPKKEFDSIQVKREAQEKIYEAIKGMTPDQEIAYFQQALSKSDLSKWWQSTSQRREISKTR